MNKQKLPLKDRLLAMKDLPDLDGSGYIGDVEEGKVIRSGNSLYVFDEKLVTYKKPAVLKLLKE